MQALLGQRSIWQRWARRGFWTLLDQGLFSGANFLVNILIARWLPPEEYGAFSVALSVFYLLAGFHTAVLTEPMMVFGAGKYREHFRKYLGMLLYGHVGLSVVISMVLGIAALVTAHSGLKTLAQALAGLAIASPFLLLLWLTRRGCYVHLRPTWAVVGSGMNLALVMVGLFLFWRQGILSPLTGLVLLGAAAGGASLLNLLQLRPQLTNFVGNPTHTMVLRDHYQYGKFSCGVNILSTLSLNLYFILIPMFLSLEDLAALRALYNLALPGQQLFISISPLLLVLLARYGDQHIRKITLQMAGIFTVVSGIYFLITGLYGGRLMEIAYENKYAAAHNLTILIAIYPFLTSQSIVWGGALRAMNSISKVFWAYVVAFILFVPLAIPILVGFRLAGAVLGLLIYGLILVTALIIQYRRRICVGQSVESQW